MKILVIEDDLKTSSFIQRGLSENGFTADTAASGEEGLQLLREAVYGLVILDVMLPALDGWSVLLEIRRIRKPLPVLFLSAQDAVEDRVKGLELGADGYLVKPFAFTELLATIRSILRRAPLQTNSEVMRVDSIELDLIRHKAIRDGQVIPLTAKEFALLELLMRRAGTAVPRSVIADQVWGINYETDTNVVDVHVKRLRTKVDDPFEQKLIHSVRGIGYLFGSKAP